jgi:hypothetical protein
MRIGNDVKMLKFCKAAVLTLYVFFVFLICSLAV